jgi:hypothetical protein
MDVFLDPTPQTQKKIQKKIYKQGKVQMNQRVKTKANQKTQCTKPFKKQVVMFLYYNQLLKKNINIKSNCNPTTPLKS